ncbi:MAG: aldo/keto reductase [Candidatus Bathyarchaeota archaeon]|nr:aldo/keto reductase [Candidatus Bathyarchaeota archaeon]
MQYRKLGRTGLKVSEIGFGCGNVGGLIIRGSYEEQVDAVTHALDLGINYFDTAASYGDGRSEINLGKVLKELDPDIILATKVGLTLDDLDDIHGAVKRSLEASLTRLQRDSVDVFQLHSRIALQRDSPEWPRSLGLEDVLGENGVADALDSVRSQRLSSYIGFTGLGETKALHRVIASGRFDVVQSYFNLLNPSSGQKVPPGFSGHDFKQLIDKAQEHGVGVAAIRVMAAGAVAGKKSRRGHAAPTIRGPIIPGSEYSKDEARARSLEFLIEGDVKTLPQAALRFVLMHSRVSTALVGFSDTQQIDEAAATSGKKPLPESQIHKLREQWRKDT